MSNSPDTRVAVFVYYVGTMHTRLHCVPLTKVVFLGGRSNLGGNLIQRQAGKISSHAQTTYLPSDELDIT